MRKTSSPRGYSPLSKPTHCRRRLEAMRISKRADYLARGANCPSVIHLVADVVEVEEVVDEVTAHAQLLVLGERVAHRGEETSLESMKRGPLLLLQPTSLEEPLLRLCRGELAVRVDAKWVGTRRNEVREDDAARAVR